MKVLLLILFFSISFLTNAGSKKGRSARRHDDEDTKNFKICGESETLQLLAPAVAKTLLSTFGSDCISIEGNFNFLGVQSISSLLNRPSLTHNHDNDCGALRKYVARYEKGGYFSRFVFFLSITEPEISFFG